MINPTILDSAEALHARFMSHPISEEYLPSALMKFYTGKPKLVLTFTTMTVNFFSVRFFAQNSLNTPKVLGSNSDRSRKIAASFLG